MPIAKAVVARSPLPSGLIGTDQLTVVVVDVLRQLARLVAVCDVMFAELTTDVEDIRDRVTSLSTRTAKLAERLDTFDAVTVKVPEGSLCTDGQHIARRSSVTDFSGRVSRRLFTVDSRPQSLHLLYRTCVTSPVDVIAQCDVYRTDGKIGAAIFSVPIACLNDRPTEDYLTVPVAATIRRRKTIGRIVKSLRPSNRTPPNPLPSVVDGLSLSSMPTSVLLSSLTDSNDDNDDDDIFSQEFSTSGQPETVRVDVSGCGYARQFRCRVSSTTSTLCRSLPLLLTAASVDDDSDVAAEHRRLSGWRKTVCDVGDVSKTNPRRQLMVFSAVDVDRSALFRGLATRKMASSRRSMAASGGGDAGWMTLTSRQRKASAGSKSGAHGDCVDTLWRPRADSRLSCSSWRQSLKSLLKGVVRTKSSVDLWATTVALHHDVVATGARNAPVSFRRANSLPRSLKATKRRSGSDSAAAATKSLTAEDHPTDRSSRSSFGPEVTSAGERLGRSVSLSRSQVRSASSRVGRPQSIEVHIVALDDFGRPSSAAGPSCGTVTERRVHVSIPDQPWTKPFANVRLRQRGADVVDPDKYRSSSGHWSGVSGSAGTQSLHDVEFDASHVNDSAVSLSSNSVDRRATSNDDSATLKNCSSDSTLNGDVTRAPASLHCDVTDATQRERRLGLSTFNPFGCRQYLTSAELQRAVPSTPADRLTAAVTRTSKPPNPPRRTTSLSCAVPPSRSVPLPSAGERTSEIQKLASLAERLAASRRVTALSSRIPRFDPPNLADLSPPFREQSHMLTIVTTSSENKRSHRDNLSGSFLSRQTVTEAEEDEHAEFATDTIRDWPLPSPTVDTVCDNDESIRASSLHTCRSVAHHNDRNNGMPSQSGSGVNVATVENCTMSSAGTCEVGELLGVEVEDRSAQNDDNVVADNQFGRQSDVNVSGDCVELGVKQATLSVKDRVVTIADDCADGPLPVSARLIIMSPVTSRAYFVENPHRRSMCKPLTLPRVDNVDPASGDVEHPVTSSLRRNCDSELPVVVVSGSDDVDASNYGRSWYDVVRRNNGPSYSGTVVTEPRGYMSARSAVAGAGFSLGGDHSSSDARSVSSQSSSVSDWSSEMSGSLRRATSRRVTEPSALNGGRDARQLVRINEPSPVLSTRLRTPSTTGHHSINGTQLFHAAASDHTVSKSFGGVTIDKVVTKGTNLKRLKKFRHGAMGELRKDVDMDLIADVRQLSRRGADKTTTMKTYPEFIAADSSTNDWLLSQDGETEARPVFTSSLGRRESLRTCKFAGHCSGSAAAVISTQLRTGATQH